MKFNGKFDGRSGYTFAIENPNGSHLFQTEEVKQLMEPDESLEGWQPAVLCEFHPCLFNGGEHYKPTIILTNNPALVQFLGCKDKTHWPEAPGPQYLCGRDIEPAHLNLLGAMGTAPQKRHCCQSYANHPRMCHDIPAMNGQAYPVSFCHVVMFNVNMWFRSPKIGMGNAELFG